MTAVPFRSFLQSWSDKCSKRRRNIYSPIVGSILPIDYASLGSSSHFWLVCFHSDLNEGMQMHVKSCFLEKYTSSAVRSSLSILGRLSYIQKITILVVNEGCNCMCAGSTCYVRMKMKWFLMGSAAKCCIYRPLSQAL